MNRDWGKALFPEKFRPLFRPARYKVFYGGRGGAKSWAFARALLILAASKPMRVLCAREFQSSIADSVYKLLVSQIENLGLGAFYSAAKTCVRGANGSEFIFKGLRRGAGEIKSLEGVDVCWVEEAQSVSKASWDQLVPTIRKEGSEIWISFNPSNASDETYKRFVLSPPAGAVVVKVGWEDNPWLPKTLEDEKNACLEKDPEAYAHVWGGEPRKLSSSLIFAGRFSVKEFETPSNARFFHGADWGFGRDPTALVRAFAEEGDLYVDAEAYGFGVELDEMPDFFATVPTSLSWPVKADCSRPETIAFMRRRGFDVSPARKWAGCVEDGIAVLKSFRRIYVHPRCPKTAAEFSGYSYRTDRITGDVLPIAEDANNHCVDALRYAFDGYVRRRGAMRINPEILRRENW